MSKENASAHRLPGLDGLRAVSIAMVIAYHLHMSSTGVGWADSFFHAGVFGVEIFFTISGLLITWLLLREEAAHGAISLSQFYARRAVRILPPAVAYLLVILVASLVAGSMHWKPWISALLFFRDFHMTDATLPGAVDTAHYWSLSVEEQFYLIWPLLFLLLRRAFRIPFLVALLIASPIWQHLNMHWARGGTVAVFRIDQHSDAILFGCLLACAMEDARCKRVLSHPVFRSDLLALVCVLVVAATFTQKAGTLPGQLAYPTVRSACVALFVHRVIRRTGQIASPIDWILNLKPIVVVGQVSYGLYLWQQPFCMPNGMFRTPYLMGNLLAAGACTAASFFLIERPAQSLRRKLGSRTTPVETAAVVAV